MPHAYSTSHPSPLMLTSPSAICFPHHGARELCDPTTRDGFTADLSAALLLADAALVPKTRAARDSMFQDWSAFCHTHGCAPSLSNVPLQETKLAYLLVYALRQQWVQT